MGSSGATRRAGLSAGAPETRTDAGLDGRLGLVAGGDEAPAHQLGIEPAAAPRWSAGAFLAALASWRGGLLGGAFLAGDFLEAPILVAGLGRPPCESPGPSRLRRPPWPSGGLLAGRRGGLARLACGDALGGLAGLRASPPWRPSPACVVASLVALRPASADLLRTSATWLARFSRDLASIRSSWAATSWRTSSRICSLVFRLRSTKLSTHSCAWPRWMSPAFTNSRTISSARPRVTWPKTVPASRYLRIRSLLAMQQEYLKC